MDVRLLQHSLEHELDWPTRIEVAGDGEEAIDHLLSPKKPKPDLVILDLNLPKRDGTDVLKVIRIADHLYGLPVVVFSSSPEDVIKDRVDQAKVAADCYITKPLGLDELSTAVRRMRSCYETAIRIRERNHAASLFGPPPC